MKESRKIFEENTTFHFLFEQSGTFKRFYESVGHDAFDWDCCDNFKEVDYNCDLFAEIEEAIEGCDSKLDIITENDIVVAFFPCTYFSDMSQLFCSGSAYQQRNKNTLAKLCESQKRVSEMARYQNKLCDLCVWAINKKVPLIIENPFGKINFLGKYFPIKNKYVLKNRTFWGDRFKKPTQFFFINCSLDFQLERTLENSKEIKSVEDVKDKIKRSLIEPDFVEMFHQNIIKNLSYKGEI